MDSNRTPQQVEADIATIRQHMPETLKSIRSKSEVMGSGAFALVRRGLRGEPGCFYAMERGWVMGTPFAEDSGINADLARRMVVFGVSHFIIWGAASCGQD